MVDSCVTLKTQATKKQQQLPLLECPSAYRHPLRTPVVEKGRKINPHCAWNEK